MPTGARETDEVHGAWSESVNQTEHSIVRGILDKLNEIGFTLKIHGSAFGMSGVPDILFQRHGQTVWYEVKKPGGMPTPRQRHVHYQIRHAGCVVVVVHSWKEVEEDLRFRNLLG